MTALDSILVIFLMIFTEVEVTLITACGSSPNFGTAKCRKLETKAVGKFDKGQFFRHIC